METANNPQIKVESTPEVSRKSPKVRPWVFIFIFLVMLSAFMFFALNFYLKSIGVDLKELILNNEQTQEVSEVIETEENVEVIEEVEEDVITLENKGWSLYSIPEYGFSVEVPGTWEEITAGVTTHLRWDIVRRSNWDDRPFPYLNSSEDLVSCLEVINIDYYPLSYYDLDGCGAGCHGERPITVYIVDQEEAMDLDDIKTKSQESFESIFEEYPNEDFNDYIGDEEIYGQNFWCQAPPSIAGLGLKICYLETEDYTYIVKHYDITDTMDEMYKVLDTLKFDLD